MNYVLNNTLLSILLKYTTILFNIINLSVRDVFITEEFHIKTLKETVMKSCFSDIK